LMKRDDGAAKLTARHCAPRFGYAPVSNMPAPRLSVHRRPRPAQTTMPGLNDS
jgi:hypothetical protein